jgi:UDP-sugar transporter A1/2/3
MLEDARTTKHPLQMAVPAGLYLAQNNLLFVALARLSPVSFQITYQVGGAPCLYPDPV